MRKIFTIIGVITAISVGLNCASAPHRIAKEEVASEWAGAVYTDILVIGAYNDRPYRIGAETSFAEVLKSKGLTATPSYDLLPRLDDLESNAEIANQLATTSHDGVLIVATLDEGYDYDVGDYYATRGMVYLLGGEPGAGTDMGAFLAWAGSGLYTLYVGLWDVKTQDPIWQITTDSKTTGSESGDTVALAEFVVENLRGKGLLGQTPGIK